MKLIRVKNLPSGSDVKCSFCKEARTTQMIVGHPDGGRSACESCFVDRLHKESRICHAGGEEANWQISRNYGV